MCNARSCGDEVTCRKQATSRTFIKVSCIVVDTKAEITVQSAQQRVNEWLNERGDDYCDQPLIRVTTEKLNNRGHRQSRHQLLGILLIRHMSFEQIRAAINGV